MIKCIVSDLDGTLINASQGVDSENIEAINRWMELGHHFVVASARTYDAFKYVNKKYNTSITKMIGHNGSVLFEDGVIVWEKTLPKEVIKKFYDNIKPYMDEVDFVVTNATTKEMYTAHFEGLLYNTFVKPYGMSDQSIEFEKYFNDDVTFESHIIFMMVETMERKTEIMELLKEKLFDECTISSSGKRNIELSCKGIDKGSGIVQFCKHHGLDVSEVACIGNDENDIAMLNVVAYPYIMDDSQPVLDGKGKRVKGVFECINDCILMNKEGR